MPWTASAIFGIYQQVNLVQFYKCLGDRTRLRILNLLQEGPLCVCHLVELLGCDQVKMSKQLRYLKRSGLLACKREAQWSLYRLASPEATLLKENLRCLRTTTGEELGLQEDLRKRTLLLENLRKAPSPCAQAVLTAQVSLAPPASLSRKKLNSTK